METILYDGRIKLKFTDGNHCYYAASRIDEDTWSKNKVAQGVTSTLKELYPQDTLLEWYSSMAAQDIVLKLAGDRRTEQLKKAFMAHFKGETPIIDSDLEGIVIRLNTWGLYELYKLGKEAPHKRSQYGKDVGTQVHEAIDRYHKGEPSPDLYHDYIENSGDAEQDKVALKSFQAYVKWFEQSGLEVVVSERMLYSEEYNFAGTVDRIYRTPEGGLILGDFKTSNLSKTCYTGVRESYWSQLGAYMKAYREEFGVEFIDAMIVNSPKNGSLKVVYASDAGFNPQDLENIWLDDLKASRNHKFMRNAKLRSRT